MRGRFLHFSLVLILVGSMIGCGGGINTTTSVPATEGMQKSGEAGESKARMDSSAAGRPNSPEAMPSYMGGGYPTGQGSSGAGAPGGGPPGGAPQPGK